VRHYVTVLGRPRRSAVILLTLAVILAACGGGKKKAGNDQYGSPLLSDTTTSVAPPATSAATTATTKKTGTTTKSPVITVPTPKSVPPTGDPVLDASKKAPGDLTGLMLGPGPVKKIVYELMQQDGAAPIQHTVDHVVANLRQFSGKPVDIEHTSLPAGPSHWSVDQIYTYADTYSRFKSKGDTVALHILFLNGDRPGGPSGYVILGQAVRADVLGMWPGSYRGRGNGVPDSQLEDALSMHETGHLLGLVDEWLNDGRGDYVNDPAPGGHHSPNKKSVMYYEVDTQLLTAFLNGGPPVDYDALDAKDLTAIHNGAARGSKA
jgi:hypothetical protein